MRLQEYQSKQVLSRYGVPIPRGRVAATANEAKQIAEELGCRVVIKSQVLVGGRSKAGGIRLAKSPKEAEDVATQILGMEIKGLPVRKILVDEAATIEKEIYLGITNDRTAAKPVIIASSAGGADIEEVAQVSPEKIIRIYIDPLLGIRDYQARDIAASIDLPREHWKTLLEIIRGLWKAFIDTDATLAEVNPIVITDDHRIVALDAKLIIDDNALFRHPDLAEMRDIDSERAAEIEARKYGLCYVRLGGEIGCMVNGAGLALATMDVIQLLRGEPANFLDIGDGTGSEKVSVALRIILSDPNIKVVLINIFGGITCCDEVAHGIITAIQESKTIKPIVVRLTGTNAEEGKQLLTTTPVILATTLCDAAQKAVDLVNTGGLDGHTGQ